MEVKIVDYGISPDSKEYYISFKVSGIDYETLNKLLERLTEDVTERSGELYIKLYFKKEYFPLGSHEAKYKLEDYIAREEIEMMAYLSSLLED
ncbi:MAG: hypothetical protein FJ150_04430 [Euryarchaeota archaeon]|nr:hypothetical protein [Euryarchaeota archaeon]